MMLSQIKDSNLIYLNCLFCNIFSFKKLLMFFCRGFCKHCYDDDCSWMVNLLAHNTDKSYLQRQGSEKWEGQLKMQHMQIQKAHECSKANEILMRTHFSSMLQNIEHSLSSPPAVVGHLQAIQLPPSHDTPLTSFVVSSTSQGLVPHSQLSTTATSVSPSPSISITPETTASLRKRGSKSESLAPTTNVQAVPLSMSALMKTSKVLVGKL